MGKIHGNKTLLEVLGLRDISKPLYNKTLEFIYKYDVIRGIRLDKEIIRNGERLYHFEAVEYGLGGLIYPLDEIVHVNRMCDIIIHNWKKRTNPIKIDAQIYHDCKRGERISVKISRKSFGEEPSFKIFNMIGGFVKDWGENKDIYKNIKIGSKVLVEVDHLWEKNGKIHLLAKPIRFL